MFHQFNNQIPVIIHMGVKPSAFCLLPSALGFDILCAVIQRTERKGWFIQRDVATEVNCFFHLEKRVWVESGTNHELKPVEQVELTFAAIKANAGKYLEK